MAESSDFRSSSPEEGDPRPTSPIDEDRKNIEINEDTVREYISKRSMAYSQEEEELKRTQSQRMTSIKQQHILKEKSISNSNDFEYQDLMWEIGLKYFGKAQPSDNIGALFEKASQDAKLAAEKDLIAFKLQLDEEYVAAKQAIESKKRASQLPSRHSEVPLPCYFAQEIFSHMKLAPEESNDSTSDEIQDLIDAIQMEKRWLVDPRESPEDSPKRKPRKMKSRKDLEKKVSEQLHGHIREREKLQATIESTEKFMKQLRQNACDEAFFPHLSPKKR